MLCWSHVILRRAAALRCDPAAKSLAPARPRPPETYRARAGQQAPTDQAVRRGGEQRRTASEGDCFRSAHVRCCTRGRRSLRPRCGGQVRPRSRDLDVVHPAGKDPHPATSTTGAHSQVEALSTRHKHKYRHNPDKSCEVSHRNVTVSCGQPLRQTVTRRDRTLTRRCSVRPFGRPGDEAGQYPMRAAAPTPRGPSRDVNREIRCCARDPRRTSRSCRRRVMVGAPSAATGG